MRDGERLAGMAMAYLFEKDGAAGVGAAVDGEDGVAIVEAGGDALWCRMGDEGSVIALVEGRPSA